MRIFSWVMAGMGLGVALTIMMMNAYKKAEEEYKEAQELPATGHAGHADEEEWPAGKSFDWSKPRAAKSVEVLH